MLQSEDLRSNLVSADERSQNFWMNSFRN